MVLASLLTLEIPVTGGIIVSGTAVPIQMKKPENWGMTDRVQAVF